MRFRMHTIPQPAENEASVIQFTGEGTVAMKGGGKHDFLCGQCDAVILQGLARARPSASSRF